MVVNISMYAKITTFFIYVCVLATSTGSRYESEKVLLYMHVCSLKWSIFLFYLMEGETVVIKT